MDVDLCKQFFLSTLEITCSLLFVPEMYMTTTTSQSLN